MTAFKKREEKLDLLFEIGVEEMPSTPLDRALVQLETLVPTVLDAARLTYDDVTLYATPRRIAVLVRAIPVSTPDTEAVHKGPAAAIAYTDGEDRGDGGATPTKALEGFVRSKGATLADVEVREVDGTAYTFVTVREGGTRALDTMPEVLDAIITGIDWPKTQRWGDGEVRFIRPVRTLLALFGGDIVPYRFGDLSTGRITYGHRFLSSRALEVAGPSEYLSILRANFVIAEQLRRRDIIAEQARTVAQPYGHALLEESVLSEVVNLTEYPTALLGTFDEEFLRLPREILVCAMARHQRYFAVERTERADTTQAAKPGARADAQLDNHFVVTSNGDPKHNAQIIAGHERVVRARLADAAFFYDEDLKVPLDEWNAKLDSVVFHDKLGTVGDKVRRIVALTTALAEGAAEPSNAASAATPAAARTMAIVDEHTHAFAVRAAELCKADLVTHAVTEFPELQGVMGSHYARAAGEKPQVATAIAEHYRPRFSGDDIPGTLPGQLVSIADKIDTIAGIFAAGMQPKGTSDPFALRRSAIAITNIARQAVPLDFATLAALALAQLDEVLDFDRAEIHAAIGTFFTARLETILREEGYRYDTVNAVLAVRSEVPTDAEARCDALEKYRETDDMVNLAIAFTRAKNLVTKNHTAEDTAEDIDTALLTPPERLLFDALLQIEREATTLLAEARYEELLVQLATLRAPVDTFFDEVMVMDEDADLRRNRLMLLGMLVALVTRLADISLLVDTA